MEDEDLEEFDADEEIEYRKKISGIKKPLKPLPKPSKKLEPYREVEEEVEEERPTPQRKTKIEKVEQTEQVVEEPRYITIPRVVPIETMLNEIYNEVQEIKQILASLQK